MVEIVRLFTLPKGVLGATAVKRCLLYTLKKRALSQLQFKVVHQAYFIAPPYSFYIGLKRISNERYGFEWIDGSPLTYSDWYPGDPNNAATGPSASNYEGCVTMGWRYSNERGLQWGDVQCNNWQSLYICQRGNSELNIICFY